MIQEWTLGIKREKIWKSRVSNFFFLSCLWEDGRLTGSNLYPIAEGENSGIWTCGCLDLLPSPFLFSTEHSMVMANCLIKSFCFCPIEFKVPSNSPWAEYILIKAFSPALIPIVQGALQFFAPIFN